MTQDDLVEIIAGRVKQRDYIGGDDLFSLVASFWSRYMDDGPTDDESVKIFITNLVKSGTLQELRFDGTNGPRTLYFYESVQVYIPEKR